MSGQRRQLLMWLGVFVSFARRVVDVFRPRRARTGMPSVAEFARIGRERTTEWHRQAGIEARVAAATGEPDPRDGDPLRAPDPEPAPVDPIRHWIPSAAENPGCGTLLAIIGCVVLAILVAAPRSESQPVEAPVPPSQQVAPATVGTLSGAPQPFPRPSVSPVHSASGQAIQPSGAPPLRGFAAFCDPTPKRCQGWGEDVLIGGVNSFRWGDEPYTVRVRYGERSVRVRVISFCACGDRQGIPTLIDLSPYAMSKLDPNYRKLGILRVTVEGLPEGVP